MLEHDTQAGEVLQQGLQHRLDEYSLAVEHIYIGADHLAVNQQRHVDALHCFEHGSNELHRCHAVIGIGRRMRWVELARGKHAGRETRLHFGCCNGIGQVGRHQRLESRIRRQRRHNTRPVVTRLLHGRHRRGEVRHDDGAAELHSGVRRNRGQHVAVAQVHVPVVGAADYKSFCGHGIRSLWFAGGANLSLNGILHFQ